MASQILLIVIPREARRPRDLVRIIFTYSTRVQIEARFFESYNSSQNDLVMGNTNFA
jgi:hypothetical protein